ncbi:hypothetical protein CEXT_133671 [Caerostris extrusa]|uniref:Uncharacterized protein n=1 Tax=Caerostris extrusa TaxID=172846 RepID=A0AAV4SDQ3_CAEEX|nr:hypothetical protein CEXT_133671 [Caerostris extrusa]
MLIKLHDLRKELFLCENISGEKVVINGRTLKLVDDALAGINVANCLHSCVEEPCKNGGHLNQKWHTTHAIATWVLQE